MYHETVKAFEDSREASRLHAQDATEMLQEKNREVEWLRAQKAVDDVSAILNSQANFSSLTLTVTARARG